MFPAMQYNMFIFEAQGFALKFLYFQVVKYHSSRPMLVTLCVTRAKPKEHKWQDIGGLIQILNARETGPYSLPPQHSLQKLIKSPQRFAFFAIDTNNIITK